jgi:hypothetical protein
MLKHKEIFWEILGDCERFWEIVRDSKRFLEILRDSGRFWEILGDSGRFWEILGDSRRFWEILGDSGRFWEILGNFGKFWEILRDTKRFWVTCHKSYLDRNVKTHLIHGNFLWTHAQNLKCCLSEYIPNYQWRVEVGLHCPDQVLFLHNSKDYQ